jgi:glucose/arabinose dehydrogenase
MVKFHLFPINTAVSCFHMETVFWERDRWNTTGDLMFKGSGKPPHLRLQIIEQGELHFMRNSFRTFGYHSLISMVSLTFLLCSGTGYLISAAATDCDLTLDQLQATDFKSSLVVNGEKTRVANGKPQEPFQAIAKPTQIGFIPGNNRYIFFNEIYKGTIKKWDMEAKTMSTLIDLDLVTTGERGLTGFVFHPKFAINHWVFVVYNDSNKLVKLARFEYDLTADKLIKPKILIEHKIKTDLHHYGNGQLTIDDNGYLFMGMGSDADFAGDNLYGSNLNQNAEATGGNTNTISSGFIRIIPDSSAKGYRIPAGNFGEYFEKYFRDKGNIAVADEYKTKVLPEIYVKGIRTCYTATTHPKKGWLAWGEVNTSNNWDEYDIIKNPMFSGYPYFHGNNETLKGTNPNINANPTQPVANKSQFNNGVSLLPPPQAQSLPPLNKARTTSATAGAIYDFDSHAGINRFPKAFDQHFLMFDFEQQDTHMFVSKLEENGNAIKAGPQINVSRLLDGVFMKSTLDAEFSPAGELYLLNVGDNTYGTCGNQCGSIDKVIYTGGQCPQTVTLNTIKPQLNFVRLGNELQSKISTPMNVRLYSLNGKLFFSSMLLAGKSMNLKTAINGQGKVPDTSTLFILSLTGDGISQTETFLYYF